MTSILLGLPEVSSYQYLLREIKHTASFPTQTYIYIYKSIKNLFNYEVDVLCHGIETETAFVHLVGPAEWIVEPMETPPSREYTARPIRQNSRKRKEYWDERKAKEMFIRKWKRWRRERGIGRTKRRRRHSVLVERERERERSSIRWTLPTGSLRVVLRLPNASEYRRCTVVLSPARPTTSRPVAVAFSARPAPEPITLEPQTAAIFARRVVQCVSSSLCWSNCFCRLFKGDVVDKRRRTSAFLSCAHSTVDNSLEISAPTVCATRASRIRYPVDSCETLSTVCCAGVIHVYITW